MMTTKTATRFVVVNPMTASEESIGWKSKKSASDAKEEARLSSAYVVMTEKQWAKFLGQAQGCETESEQRALVSAIVGYDY